MKAPQNLLPLLSKLDSDLRGKKQKESLIQSKIRAHETTCDKIEIAELEQSQRTVLLKYPELQPYFVIRANYFRICVENVNRFAK